MSGYPWQLWGGYAVQRGIAMAVKIWYTLTPVHGMSKVLLVDSSSCPLVFKVRLMPRH